MKYSRCISNSLLAGIPILGALISSPALAQRPLGLDCSTYQGTSVNWTSVKSAGIAFAWSRADDGTGVTDNTFSGNMTRGKAAGVIMGGYHFAQPNENTPAAGEAHFWNLAGGYILGDGLSLQPMLDMEVFSGITGASSYAAWVNDWCSDIVQAAASKGVGIKPAIYISACHAAELNSSVSQWYNDIANYNGESAQTGTPWNVCNDDDVWGSGVWNFWQYNDTASLAGFPGEQPDVDVYNGTLASLTSKMVPTSAASPIYYWDPQGTSGANPYTGSMTGTWEATKWSTAATGLAIETNWVDGKAACFGVHTGAGTPAFTITMNSDHVVAGIFDGALSQAACNVTITGTGVIDLASGAQGLDVKNGSDGSLAVLTINNEISDSGQVFTEGNGQIFLNGPNSYTGGTVMGYPGNPFSGLLNFNNGSAFGTGDITLTTNGNGSAFVAEGTAAITIPNNVVVQNTTTNNFVGNAAGVTWSGNWSLGANLLTIETGATAGYKTILSGVVSGSAGLRTSDNGILVFTGTNTYTGTTTIATGATLTIDGAGLLGSGSYAGAIANSSKFIYSSTGIQTLSGVISGTGTMTQNDAGTLILTGVNTYTGTTTIGSGSTFTIDGAGKLGSGTYAAAIANSGTFNYSSTTAQTLSGVVSGSGSLNTLDVGVLTLTAADTYSGNTVIGAGTLALGSAASVNNTPSISIAAGATFDVSAIASYSLSASTTLTAGGTSTAATIKGGTTVNLGSQPIILNFDGTHPALTISQGTLSLNGNAFTVNGALLVGGQSYILVQQTTGNITSAGTYSVTGTAIGAPGTSASIAVVGGNVVLTITDMTTTTTLNAFSNSVYGQSVTFTATVSPAPASGTVQFYDNGIVLGSPVAISGGTASYTTGTLSVANHPITATYNRTLGYEASTSTLEVQSVSQAALSVTASAQTKTYGTLLTFGSGSTNFTSTGLKNGETIGTVTLAVSGNGGATNAPGGTYTITPSAATGGTFTNANYSITYITNTLTVTTIPAMITGIQTLTNGTMQLSFTGNPGIAYLIEAATNFGQVSNWMTLGTNTADTNGAFSFIDMTATNYPGRYYRTATQ